MRVSIDIVFYKNELFRISVHVLRTIELDALEIFKAVVDCGGVTKAAAQLLEPRLFPRTQGYPRYLRSISSSICAKSPIETLAKGVGSFRGDYAKRKKLYAPVDIPRGDVQRNQRMCPSTGHKKRGCQANKQRKKLALI